MQLYSLTEDTRGFGSFMNFSAYPRHLTRDVCSPPQLSDRGPARQVIGNGKFHLNHPWQQSYSPSAPPPSFFLQGSSASGVCSSFTSSGVPPGECHAGVSADSTCALSLLSNQPQPRCSSRSQTSDVRVNEMLPNHENVALSCASPNHFPDYASWDFKASYDSGIQSDLGLCQFSRLDSHFSGEVELSQQIRRQYAGLNNSRAFEASWLVDWPL
ncbi:hypothetical protein SAY87_007564 [Trapa incisa]|uniref:Uncharacterized protein n=1 Tax=Trapa incisa TaxID=236973 RepID=A0AAN7KN05_9MYRT|nr:hypothetical protein SAY87_007564 [Trapa incisa]